MLHMGLEKTSEDESAGYEDDLMTPNLEAKYKDPPIFEDDEDVYLCYTRPSRHHVFATNLLYETHTTCTYPKSWSRSKATHAGRKLREAYNQRTDFYYKAPAFRVVNSENLDTIVNRLSSRHTFSTQSKVTSPKSPRKARSSDSATTPREGATTTNSAATWEEARQSAVTNTSRRSKVKFKDHVDGSSTSKKDAAKICGDSTTVAQSETPMGKNGDATDNGCKETTDKASDDSQPNSRNSSRQNSPRKNKSGDLSDAEVAERIARLCRGTSTSRIREASVKYKGKPQYADSVKVYSAKSKSASTATNEEKA